MAWQNRIVGEAMVSPDALVPHPLNWRGHPRVQADALSGVLGEVGWVQRVVVNRRTGHLLDGHLRVELALSRQEATVPVVYVDVSEDEERLILATLDPLAALAERDEQALSALLDGLHSADEAVQGLLTDLSGEQTAPPVREDAGPQIDQAEALREQWGVESGQLWQCGEHVVLCGDSTDDAAVASLFAHGQPQMMVTDPPYGVDYDPLWRDDLPWAVSHAPVLMRGRVTNDARNDWRAAYRLFPGAVAYVWHSGVHAAAVAQHLGDTGYEIRAQLIWVKHAFAISRGHYHWQHEPCWYAVRRGATAEWAGDRTQTTVWEIAGFNVSGAGTDDPKLGHGTQKPLECMARPMRNHYGPGAVVYDPFLGSGTTLIACEQLGRRCLGVDILPQYVAVTLQRFADTTGQTPVRR
jgi:DNA modification methylase